MSTRAANLLETLLRALLLVLLAAQAWAQPGERILDYDIEVDVRPDGTLLVAEHITVRAEQNRIRRGIYRDFPTRYRDRFGNNVVVDLEVIGVERDGAPEAWFTERLSNGVRINTGGDDFLPRFPAEYRYTLRYRTTRQLGFFEDHDELYWNAIGTGWDFSIDKGRVEVRLPERVAIDAMQVEAYTGPQGAKGQAYRATRAAPGVARFELTEPLPPRNGLTVVVMFPKGLVTEPTAAQRAGWLLRDNAGLLATLVGLALLLVYCAARWQRVGRDPRRGTIIARYEPPEDRSPAELRYLLRRRYDPRCFTSDLLISAVEGRVTIEREPRWLLGDRWFVRAAGSGTSTAPYTVAALTAALFGKGDTVELDKKNATLLQRVRTAHAKALDSRLRGSHFQRNGGSVAVAAGIALLTGVLAFQLSGGGSVGVVVLCGLMAVTVFVFAWLVQAPTQEGRRLMDEAEGLKLYLSVAERDELAAMQNPDEGPERPVLDAGRYERLLPYAVALDVEEAWTKKFTAAVGAAAAAAATSHIAWYRGGRADDLGGIAKAVGAGLTSSIASASTPPGSSSGGGGGGSSGGGGGGGGGGGR